jgi:CBS domain-containing protein
MKARDVMTRTVKTIGLSTPIRDVADLLVRHRISAAPVVDKKRHILGIVSEGDLLRRTEAGTEYRRSWWAELLGDPRTRAREYVKSRGGHARDVMTPSVVCAGPLTDVAEIANLMENRGIKRVPIVQAGRLVGIVSRADLVRAVARPKRAKPAKHGDVELRQRLESRLAGKTWGARNLVNFVVNKGRVELFGIVHSGDQRDAIRVLAENTTGVQAVKDRLTVMPNLIAT